MPFTLSGFQKGLDRVLLHFLRWAELDVEKTTRLGHGSIRSRRNRRWRRSRRSRRRRRLPSGPGRICRWRRYVADPVGPVSHPELLENQPAYGVAPGRSPCPGQSVVDGGIRPDRPRFEETGQEVEGRDLELLSPGVEHAESWLHWRIASHHAHPCLPGGSRRGRIGPRRPDRPATGAHSGLVLRGGTGREGALPYTAPTAGGCGADRSSPRGGTLARLQGPCLRCGPAREPLPERRSGISLVSGPPP